jgi:hypothetical protein
MVLSGGCDFGPFLPSLFLFSDPAPPDWFLLDISSKKKSDPPLGDPAAGVLIGVTREPAALADKPGLGGPVVRMNMPASGTFLRTVVRWNLDHQFSAASGLVRKEKDKHPPAGRQNRPVGTGLGSCSVFDVPSGFVFLCLRLPRHVFDLQILDDEEAPFRVCGKITGGLVDDILPNVFRIFFPDSDFFDGSFPGGIPGFLPSGRRPDHFNPP